MIPKIIHYCWFGRGEKSITIQKCMASWREFCQDWEIIEWNEDNFDVNAHPFTEAAYKAKKWAFVADYCRLKVLYEHGGIYMDTDMMVNKPLDPLTAHPAFFATYLFTEGISCGIVGAKKNAEIIKRLLKEYDSLELSKGDMQVVNPLIYTRVLASEYGFCKAAEMVTLRGGIVVYPPNILHLNIHDNKNICEHLSENSWFNAETPSYYLELKQYFFDIYLMENPVTVQQTPHNLYIRLKRFIYFRTPSKVLMLYRKFFKNQ